MVEDVVKLDSILLKKIINQLINSDGMEVKNSYLIQKHIYYIDNVELVEQLEKLLIRHYYNLIFNKNGNVNPEELFSHYSPQYINYDKYFNELEKEHNPVEEDTVKKNDYSLNKYL